MRVVHVCLTGPFNDGWTYQENMLARHHRLVGHEVMVLATPYATDTHTGSYRWHRLGSYIDPDGVRVVRVAPVTKSVCRRWSRFNVYRGVRRSIERFCPDVIFIHGCQCLDVLAVARYCRTHLSVRVFVDNHADWLNSGTNWLSRTILHGVLWRHCVRLIEPHTVRFWGITDASCRFLTEVYGVAPTKVGLLPLGAEADDLLESERAIERSRVRRRAGIAPGDFLVVTGGKIDRSKNAHLLMQAISELALPNVKLLVFGSVLDDVRDEFFSLLESPAIQYVGWACPADMMSYFVAADLAVFPGGQSALWNQVVLSGIPALFRRWEGGSPVDIGGNCLFLDRGDVEEISVALRTVITDDSLYRAMRTAALGDGRLRFSYRRIARLSIGGDE